MKMNDVFPSKFLKAEDLDADITVTIHDVSMEEFKGREGKPDEQKAVAYFVELEKGLVINKTNWKTLVEVTGEEDTDNWKGHKITLCVIDVDSFGDVVAAIRVKKAKAADPAVQNFWAAVNNMGLTRKDGLEVLAENKGDFLAALKALSVEK
jgi:hypothetical protein